MNSVLLHLLILWAIVAVLLGAIFVATQAGLTFAGLKYAGIFGFVGAAFGVVIGMTTFFASQHYADVRKAAQSEATSVGELGALSGSFPRAQGQRVREQLFCYATDVIDQEWSTTHGEGAPSVTGRERAVYLVLLRIGRTDPELDTWYSDAVRAALDIGEQRQDRLLLSQAQIPLLLWILIYLGAAIIVVFAFLFHLSGRVQLGGMLVTVVVMLTAVVGVLAGLDAPTEEPFGLNPVALERERELLAPDIDTRGAGAGAYCANLPAPEYDPGSLR